MPSQRTIEISRAVLIALLVAAGCKRDGTRPSNDAPSSESPPPSFSPGYVMSYDELSLLPSHRSATSVRRKNPFTGEDAETYLYTLTEEEARKTNAVLARHRAKDDGEGTKIVRFTNGERVEVRTGESSWSLSLRSLTPDVVKFVFELTSAGNFLVVDDKFALTTSTETKERLKDFSSANGCVVVKSAEEMGVLLREGFEGWKAYAKKVSREK